MTEDMDRPKRQLLPIPSDVPLRRLIRQLPEFLRRGDIRAHPVRYLWRRIWYSLAVRTRPTEISRDRLATALDQVTLATSLDDLVGRSIYLTGAFEWVTSQLLGRLLQPGMTFIDVGAHIGYFTVLAGSIVGPSGRVLAVEPNPDNYRRLSENVKLNLLDNVDLRQIAVSDHRGSGILHIPKDGAGAFSVGASLLPVNPTEYFRGFLAETVTVELTTIGFLTRDLGRDPDVLKIDVEGLEWEAIAGGVEILERCRPAVLLEANELFHSSPAEVRSLDLLRALGYSCFGISIDVDWEPRLVELTEGRIGEDQKEPSSINILGIHPASRNWAYLLANTHKGRSA